MKRDIHSITDLVTGPVDVGDIPLYHTTGGWKSVADQWVDIRAFGAYGDGTHDDTVAMQAFVDYVVANAKNGFIPAGTYLISSRINVSCRPGWSIVGAGRYITYITQNTDNTPVFFMGSDAVSLMHSWTISGFSLGYTNSQPAANTSANCIHFEKTPFKFRLEEINFNRGAYGIKLKSGIDAPWGGYWNQLSFASGLTIGAMNWTGGTSSAPNNVWGRMDVDCLNMVGPVFVIYGYNWTIQAIEFLRALNGPNLITFAAGSRIKIGSLKLEIGSYATAKTLFDFSSSCKADIGTISVGGTTMEVIAAVGVNVVTGGTGGGTTHRITIDSMDVQATSVGAGSLQCFGGSNITVGKYEVSGGARLANNASTATPETIWVNEFVNNRLSADKGNADYTVTLGDPNIATFETALTGIRTVTLPSDGTNMHNGLYYEIRNQNAVNGANTLVIKSAATTLYTETAVKSSMRFTWRRNVNANLGWKMTTYSTLP